MNETVKEHCIHKDCKYRTRFDSQPSCGYMMITGKPRGCSISKCEIDRVENALKKTASEKLRHDYGKYLKRLKRDLKYYDRQMKTWQTNRI